MATYQEGRPVAYPFSVLSAQQVINDEVEGLAVLALWQSGVATALGAGTIDEGRDIGTAALYERTLADGQTLSFVVDGGVLRGEQTGSTWNYGARPSKGRWLASAFSAPWLPLTSGLPGRLSTPKPPSMLPE